jgi:uncharacterized protein YcfL
MKIRLLSLITLLLIGCSNKQIYNSVQENQRMECGKLPQNQYEECMREYSTSYEEYEREREASINNESAQ